MIKSIIKIQATVVKYGKVTNEIRYYVSDLQLSAKEFLHIIRNHWKIENSLHYVKDVSFEEYHSRIRTKQAPFVALLCSVALLSICSISTNLPTSNRLEKNLVGTIIKSSRWTLKLIEC